MSAIGSGTIDVSAERSPYHVVPHFLRRLMTTYGDGSYPRRFQLRQEGSRKSEWHVWRDHGGPESPAQCIGCDVDSTSNLVLILVLFHVSVMVALTLSISRMTSRIAQTESSYKSTASLVRKVWREKRLYSLGFQEQKLKNSRRRARKMSGTSKQSTVV